MRKKLIVVAILLFVVLLGIVSTKLFDSQSQMSAARKVSDTFISDVLSAKADESYSLFTGSQQRNLDKTTWTTKVHYLSGFFSGQASNYASSNGPNSLRVFNYTIMKGSTPYTLSVTTVPSGSTWRVQSFVSRPESS